MNGVACVVRCSTEMPYALASPATTASVDGLAASMLFQTKRCQDFQAREIIPSSRK